MLQLLLLFKLAFKLQVCESIIGKNMNRRFLLQNIFLRNFRKHELKDLKPHVFFCRYYTILSHQLSTPNQYFLSQKNIKIQPFYTNCFLKRAHHHHECIRKLDCWQCGKEINAELEQFFCECGVLQPPITTRSYFQIFGLPESFDIDMQKLKIGLQGLQLLLHPDKCANKSKVDTLSNTFNFHYFSNSLCCFLSDRKKVCRRALSNRE